MKFLHLIFNRITLLSIVLLFSLQAISGDLSVMVTDHNGNPLDSVEIHKITTYSSDSLSTTDATGSCTINIPDGNYEIKAIYNKTSLVKAVTVSGNTSLSFQTSLYKIKVINSQSNPLQDVSVNFRYGTANWKKHFMGKTNSLGEASIQLFKGEHAFLATKDHTSIVDTLELNSEGSAGTLTLQTSKYTVEVLKADNTPLQNINTAYKYGNKSWQKVSLAATNSNGKTSIELFPGKYKFKAYKDQTSSDDPGSTSSDSLEINTSGSSDIITFNTSKFIILVTTSTGNPLTGLNVYYKYSTNSWDKMNIGQTNTNGKVSIELFPGNHMFYTLKDETASNDIITTGDDSLEINNAGASGILHIKTAKATAQVLDYNNVPISGAEVAYKYGQYSSNKITAGTTDSYGKASIELFPGTRKFISTYDGYIEEETFSLVYTGNPNDVDVIFNSPTDDVPFPVELISFKADNNDDQVTLSWITASETNNDFFSIQRSTDTESWNTIATIPGAGSSNETNYYRHNDSELPDSKTFYYRLKQTDYNGKFEYSKILDVQLNSINSNITLLPNPVSNVLYIHYDNQNKSSNNNKNILIFDNLGNKLYQDNKMPKKIDVSNFSRGIYYIKFINETGKINTQKFIVK